MPSDGSSDQPAIVVEGIGKRYLLGEREPYRTLRSTLAGLPGRVVGRRNPRTARDSIWALRDVSFAAHQGEVLGIVGANGAGKSTLLKLLARVTSPTEGRATLRGKASALLEVGTGFHPELTGRENVFLNGAVLGMRRRDIAQKFDEIVEFSGVEAFIDTPMKRYSSGMQVRLAFAVGAFLEPEILIVDEVLAVGDAAFQRKCLGKLADTCSAGRTVLFVSHNLPAVRSLCTRAILLEHGRVVFEGTADETVNHYLTEGEGVADAWDLRTTQRRHAGMVGNARVRFLRRGGASSEERDPAGTVVLRIELDVQQPVDDLVLVLNVRTMDDTLLGQAASTTSYPPLGPLAAGSYTLEAQLDSSHLQPGRYQVDVSVRSAAGVEDHVPRAGAFDVVDSEPAELPAFAAPGGYLRLPVEWTKPEPA